MRATSWMRAGLFVGVALAAGCGGGGGGGDDEGGGGGGDGTSGGEYADAIAASADAGAGAPRFEAICGACHGNGDGTEGARLRDLGWSVARMRRQIREGSGRMRPISTERLSDADLENVLAHLRTMGSIAQ